MPDFGLQHVIERERRGDYLGKTVQVGQTSALVPTAVVCY